MLYAIFSKELSLALTSLRNVNLNDSLMHKVLIMKQSFLVLI